MFDRCLRHWTFVLLFMYCICLLFTLVVFTCFISVTLGCLQYLGDPRIDDAMPEGILHSTLRAQYIPPAQTWPPQPMGIT